MSTLKSIDPVLKSAPAASEVDRELNALSSAKARLSAILQKMGERLDQAGALVPVRPEAAECEVAEVMPDSPLGNRIRHTRRDLEDIADDFDRLLSRLAI